MKNASRLFFSPAFLWVILLIIVFQADAGEVTDGQAKKDQLPEKPNIIVIVVDDAGYADFGFQGSSIMETPYLDQLRSEGTYFPQAYVTNSVCAPSRAGMLTGRYQNRFGFEFNIVTYLPAPERTNEDVGLNPEEKTVADYLKPLGYSTAMIGKWHLGEKDQHHPNNRGFDYFYGLLDGSRPYFTTSNLPKGKKLERNGVTDDLANGYLTDVLTDDAISWMGNQIDGGNPFFTVLSYTAVHGPYEAKGEDVAVAADCGTCSNKRQTLVAMTSSFDQNVGKVIAFLKNQGQYDNTLIMVIDDNGGPNPISVSPANGITDNGILRGGKSNVWEGGLRVPFIMKWKDQVPANATYDKQVIATDITATAIKAAGGDLPITKPLDGVDLVTAVNNPSVNAHDYLFFRSIWRWSAAIKDQKKLIVLYNNATIDADNDTLLYDLSLDISESNNLYTSLDDPIANDLLQNLKEWEETLELPDWIGVYQYEALCADYSNNFANCSFVSNQYSPEETAYEIEMETGVLGGDAEVVSTCATASGGAFVRMRNVAANSVTLTIQNVMEPGNYRLRMFYFNETANNLNLTVNGVTQQITLPAANYCYQGASGEADFPITLQPGSNTLSFSPIEGQGSGLLDKITLSPVAPSKLVLSNRFLRLMPGEEVEITFETSEPVLADETFDITISGFLESEYALESNQVTIPQGSNHASVLFTSLSGIGSGSYAISNLSAGIVSEGDLTGSIEITDVPGIFYVSAEGDDTNSGQSPNQPIRTLEVANQIRLIPGDQLLLRRGDVFPGQLAINSSGSEGSPIIFSNYGDLGLEKPTIDGGIDEKGAFISSVLIQGQDYIEVSGLKLTNDRSKSGSRLGVPDETAFGLYLLNDTPDRTLSYFRIRDLEIENVFPVSDVSNIDFNALQIGGINIENTRNTTESGARTIKDIIIEDNFITRVGKLAMWLRHRNSARIDGVPIVGDEKSNRIQDVIIRNNYTLETGGSGLVLSNVYNALVEGNTFEYPGSNVDPRMAARGSGAWVFSCRNIVLQHNMSLHARGPADSYGYHVDYGNEFILLQYNYSEDAEGGFVEILGDNIYSTYRYNISVNDGRRPNAKTLWVSTYAGSNTSIPSDLNYVYNNSVFVGGNQTPDIGISGVRTFVYNNIFYTKDAAAIGNSTAYTTFEGGRLNIDNNLYFGTVSNDLVDQDENPILRSPRYKNPGDLNPAAYQLQSGSAALNASIDFIEPLFPEAGLGVFANVTAKATSDYFGNPVDLASSPHLGAFNGNPLALEKVLVNLSLDAGELVPGQSTHIRAATDSEVFDAENVTVSVQGIDPISYTLSSPQITIPAEGNAGSITITSNFGIDDAENNNATIAISAVSEGLQQGNVSSVPIVFRGFVLSAGEFQSPDLIVFPNPFSDEFHLQESNTKVDRIDVTNAYGQVVFSTANLQRNIDLSFLPDAMYLVRAFQEGKQIAVFRIAKKQQKN